MISINSIRNIALRSYSFLSQYAPIISELPNKKNLYNRYISNNWKDLNEKSFEGRLACGASCYLLHYYLNNHEISTKLMLKSIGYGKYLEDHCYLLYNNEVIIDPTYRQFFSPMIKENSSFSNFLFEKLPFVFVGSFENFHQYYDILNRQHKDSYNIELDVKMSDFWENAQESNEQMDAKNVIECRKYAKNKGKLFLQLHDTITFNSNVG
jgi:hypothetical protein